MADLKIPGIRKNISLKNYTTYKIGGSAKYFCIAKKREDLELAAREAKKLGLPILILGGGSNILVSDKGFVGLVIKMEINTIELKKSKISAGAGVSLSKLAYFLSNKGYSGLEWAAGIPGTVGGAVFGNAQAFGAKISESVEAVEVLDLETMQIRKINKKQCKFSLKNSLFKKNKNFVIISALLNLKKRKKTIIKKKIIEYINYRKTKHPVKFSSAGSTFINPEIKIRNKVLLKKFPELQEHNKRGIIPSGFLISRCGLAGKKSGSAQISEMHCNFIINLGGAKAKDVIYLMKLARKKVKKVFNISLVPEVQFLGFPEPPVK